MPRYVALRASLVVVLVLSLARIAGAAPPSPTPMAKVDIPGPLLRGPDAVAAFPTVIAPDPVVRWMVDQVQEETVRQYDGDLSGEWPVTVGGASVTINTRNTNSGTPIDNATKYVGEHLTALGLNVEYHRWGPTTAPNVIGQKTGVASPGDIYMITAHLDDMPTGSTGPGADDNASGSTAVLVAADILSQFDWNCTLRFALWTGEEQGLLGSDKYAQRSHNNGENIVGVLNLDMIAWNTPDSSPDIDLHAKASMPATVDLANQTASVMTAYGLNLVPEVRSDGTGASDHASFWTYGYAAILGIEDYYPSYHDFDPYYHTTADRLATLDLGYFTEYVKAAVAETAHMAGCLVTGALQGQVSASHDGSAPAHAQVTLQDDLGREYLLQAGSDGRYSQAIPPGAYSAVASAYGYEPSSAEALVIGAGSGMTQGFVLTASSPAATTTTPALDAAEVRLTWPHVGPNTAYQVHRSTTPHFAPDGASMLAPLDANHEPAADETLTYRDAESGAGDPNTNHFYLVVGLNAAGAGAASGPTGEFDFALVAPAQQGEPVVGVN